ncbi:MAG: hypothetical protein JO074_05535 [Frankiales bacterium]|nr:hypothetical protein [Frankiales bacterium]
MRARASWLAAAATVVTLTGPLAAAHADYGDTLLGGCGFVSVQDPTTGLNDAIVYDISFSQHQQIKPSDATVSCWVTVNGTLVPGSTISSTDVPNTGLEAVAAPITFAAADSDVIQVCQKVVYADPSTWVAPDGNLGTDCRTAPAGDDPLLCPTLVQLSQLTDGYIFQEIRIHPDGDLYLADLVGPGENWIYDCPAYGNGTGSPLLPSGFGGNPVHLRYLPPTVV